MKVEDELWALNIGMRCLNAFEANGIHNLATLTSMTKRDLLLLPNLGKKSIKEIIEALSHVGLALSTGPEDRYRWIEMGKQVNQQLKGLAGMRDEFNPEKSEAEVKSTWMQETGGYARDMTLRDHFAGLFMQNVAEDYFPEDAATFAYEYADAMLEVRGKA